MYAVIETGGKQYRVEVGTELEVELLDVEPGKTITLERVLLVADGDDSTIGRPLVADATVSAEVVSQTRGPKLISFKYRPKARSRVKKGHRQELTVLRIADIAFGGKSAAKIAKKADDDARTERMKLEEAAAVQAAKDAELAAKLAAESQPAKSETKTEAKAGAKAKAATKTTTKAKADAKTSTAKTKTDTDQKTAGKTAAPKATAAKADAPKAKADALKKPRATKKDE
ncbi:MAG: 50S ribosomal protein L21 [Chloroflexota bacterium]